MLHIHWALLLVIFAAGVISTPAFILLVLDKRPKPSARQQALFVEARRAMDDARRVVEKHGPPEFVARIDVLRSVSIEQATSSETRAKSFMMQALTALEQLGDFKEENRPVAEVLEAWARTLYMIHTLTITVVYPTEDETPASRKGAAS